MRHAAAAGRCAAFDIRARLRQILILVSTPAAAEPTGRLPMFHLIAEPRNEPVSRAPTPPPKCRCRLAADLFLSAGFCFFDCRRRTSAADLSRCRNVTTPPRTQFNGRNHARRSGEAGFEPPRYEQEDYHADGQPRQPAVSHGPAATPKERRRQTPATPRRRQSRQPSRHGRIRRWMPPHQPATSQPIVG